MNTRHWFFAAAVVCLPFSVASAQKDPTVRMVEDKGVYFKLPQGWEWKSDSEAITIKQIVKVKDGEEEIDGELAFETKRLADDAVKDIQKKVAESKGGLKDLKIEKKQKLGPQRCTIATFTRVKGEGKEAVEWIERVVIFKRGDGTFAWTERFPKAASSGATGAFDAARKGFSFKDTAETNVAPVREFPKFKVTYTLPDDFEWGDRAEAKKGEKEEGGPIIRIYTTVDVKSGEFLCDFQLYAEEPEAGKKFPDNSGLYEQMKTFDPKKSFKTMEDVENLKVEKKGELVGEKTVLVTWTGAFEKNGPKKNFAYFFFNKRGNLYRWLEIVPWSKAPAPEVQAALKAARGGLKI